MKIILYGILGSISSFILLMLACNLFDVSDAESFIFWGIIILSGIICFCTGLIMNKMERIITSNTKKDD